MNNEDSTNVTRSKSKALRMDSVEINKKFSDNNPKEVAALSRMQLIYSILGLVVGVLCIIFGTYLYLNGAINNTKWIIDVMNIKSELSDAGPGAVLFVVGLLVIAITKYNIKIK